MPNSTIDIPITLDLDYILKLAIELDRYSEHDRSIINSPEKVFSHLL